MKNFIEFVDWAKTQPITTVVFIGIISIFLFLLYRIADLAAPDIYGWGKNSLMKFFKDKK